MTRPNRMFTYALITILIPILILLCAPKAEAFMFLKGQQVQQTIHQFRAEKRAQQPATQYTPGRNQRGFSQSGSGNYRPPAPNTGFGGSGGSWGGFSQ